MDKIDKNISFIQKTVCAHMKLPLEKIGAKSRKREIVQARQVCMYFSKMYTKHSLAYIGEVTGNKDHATVLHACRTINNLIDTDKEFRNTVNSIEKELYSIIHITITDEDRTEALVAAIKYLIKKKNGCNNC